MIQHADLDEHERQEAPLESSSKRLSEILDDVVVIPGVGAVLNTAAIRGLRDVMIESLNALHQKDETIAQQRETLDHIEYLATHGSAGDTRARILAILHEAK